MVGFLILIFIFTQGLGAVISTTLARYNRYDQDQTLFGNCREKLQKNFPLRVIVSPLIVFQMVACFSFFTHYSQFKMGQDDTVYTGWFSAITSMVCNKDDFDH